VSPVIAAVILGSTAIASLPELARIIAANAKDKRAKAAAKEARQQ
jgi:hypothetical protein